MVCMWLALLFWFSTVRSAAEREPQEQRIQKSRYAIMIGTLIQEATALPNVLTSIAADYAGGLWPLRIDKKFEVKEPVTCVETIGQRCVLVALDKKLRAYDIKTGKSKDIHSTHYGSITSLAHTSNFDVLTGDDQGRVHWWNIQTGVEKFRTSDHGNPIQHAFMHNDMLISAGKHTIVFRFMNTVEKESHFRFKQTIKCLLPFNKFVVAGLTDGSFRFIDITTKLCKKELHPQSSPVVDLARLGQDHIVSASDDVFISDMQRNPRMLERSNGVGNGVRCLLEFDDEVIGVPHLLSPLSRISNSSREESPQHLPFDRDCSDVIAAAGKNFFVVNAKAHNKKNKIFIVTRVDDELPEEKIDGEFVAWIEKQEVKEKKPWYRRWLPGSEKF